MNIKHITHYYENEYGPFKNICNLTQVQISKIIEKEKEANTAFNRYAYGLPFFKYRCCADNLLKELYKQKFGLSSVMRPFYGVLGDFDRTATMFRDPRKISIDINLFEPQEVTFMYEDHSHLNWIYGRYSPPKGFVLREYHGKLYTFVELQKVFCKYGIDRAIKRRLKGDGWVGCYVEAHIWKRDIAKMLINRLHKWEWCQVKKGGITLRNTKFKAAHKATNELELGVDLRAQR